MEIEKENEIELNKNSSPKAVSQIHNFYLLEYISHDPFHAFIKISERSQPLSSDPHPPSGWR